MKICPKCGKEAKQLLALSRVHNKSMICDECAIMEALDNLPYEILTLQERTKIAAVLTENKLTMENVTHN